MTEHAKLSPSAAHRWMTCPGSVRLEAGFPDQTSDHARAGSTAHALAEMALANGQDAAAYAGARFSDDLDVIDDEMVVEVQKYLDYVRGLPGHREIETRLDLGQWVPGGFGTADAVVVDGTTAHVVDLKYGKGVRVDAEENAQAMCYGLGALAAFDFLFEIETLRLVIHQPRLDHVSEWDIPAADLLAWANGTLQPAALLALTDGAPLSPGEAQCRWCRAKDHCAARAETALAAAIEGFEDLNDPLGIRDAETIDDATLARLLPLADDAAAFFKALRSRARETLLNGGEVPGYKLVAGRKGARAWGDEDAAGKALQRKLGAKAVYEKRLISPTQAERLLGEDSHILEKHVVQPDGAPTLAPVTDKRPALEIEDPAEGFENIAA